MIEVRSITLREIRLPLLRPFRTSGGEVRVRRVVLLALVGADGAPVWSECVAQSEPGYTPETVDGAWTAISEWLAPRIVGGSAAIRSASEAHGILSAGIRGHRMAIAAVEMGIWALRARQEGVPLAGLLARSVTRSAVDSGRGGADVGARPAEWVAAGTAIGMSTTPAEAARQARAALGRGYRRVRLKIAPGFDAEWISAVREAGEGRLPVVADANGSYDPDDAAHRSALERLDSLGLEMLEQPFAPQGLLAHARLAERMTTPVCLDESIGSHRDAREALELGAMAALNLKPGRVGGFQQALAIHDDCVARGTPVWCGGMLETGIGRAYNVALASLPGFTVPGDLGPSDSYWERDLVRPGWTMDRDGRVRVPLESPGIGVEVDEAFVDSLVVREAVVKR